MKVEVGGSCAFNSPHNTDLSSEGPPHLCGPPSVHILLSDEALFSRPSNLNNDQTTSTGFLQSGL